MDIGSYNIKDIVFSLDIGTRSVIGTVGVIQDKKFKVIKEVYKEHEERAMIDGQIHDIDLVAKVVKQIKDIIEEELKTTLKNVSIAAAGRFLKTSEGRAEVKGDREEVVEKEIVRSLELSAVQDAENIVNQKLDGKLYCVGYTVKEYFLNTYSIANLLGHKGDEIGASVIATFLPRTVVDSLYTVIEKVGLEISSLTLEPIAAIEAVVPKKLRLLNIALVDIGAGTSDIAISKNQTVCFYGMVPIAGDEITEIIAQEYLIDFNLAEKIKKSIEKEEEITYVDVLGIENTIKSEEVKKLIKPIVQKMAEAISQKIIDGNGGKSPAAVFLVGGGAHTPYLSELLQKELNLQDKRIAIKDRLAVEECVSDNGLGSAGVTVLGIALVAIKKLGDNFIDVKLNGDVVSLFNSHKHTVMDVMLQAGINSSLLISKNGKTKRYLYNGKKRLIFGEIGKHPIIRINGKDASLEDEVNLGDNIEVEYAKDGKTQSVKICEVIEDINSISIFVDDKPVCIEPIAYINDKKVSLDTEIEDGDNVTVISPDNIEDIKKYILNDDRPLYIDGIEAALNYKVKDGDKLKSFELEESDNNILSVEEEPDEQQDEVVKNQAIEEKITEKAWIIDNQDEKNKVRVIVNDEEITLKGKNEYIFVDVFNYIEFNLTIAKGELVLLLNDKIASYTSILNEGDIIKIFWRDLKKASK